MHFIQTRCGRRKEAGRVARCDGALAVKHSRNRGTKPGPSGQKLRCQEEGEAYKQRMGLLTIAAHPAKPRTRRECQPPGRGQTGAPCSGARPSPGLRSEGEGKSIPERVCPPRAPSGLAGWRGPASACPAEAVHQLPFVKWLASTQAKPGNLYP